MNLRLCNRFILIVVSVVVLMHEGDKSDGCIRVDGEVVKEDVTSDLKEHHSPFDG